MPVVVSTIVSYSLREAAEKVGLAHMTVWRDIKAGKLVAHKRGRHYVILADDLLEYVLAHRDGRGIPQV
jgi:excisionase family DNA binding protein